MALRQAASSRHAPEQGPPRQLFRRIADALPHMLWTMRPDGSVGFVNARIVEYTGMSAGRLTSRGWRTAVHPDDRESSVASFRHALRTGRGAQSECRVRRADGQYRWHLWSLAPLRDAAGHIVLWCGVATDIEERKRAERRLEKARRALESLVAARTRALEESGSRFREFLDRMPAIAWIKDSRFRYVWVSESYRRILGKSQEDVLGRENSEIWPRELARRGRRDDEKALRVNGPVQSIYTVPLPGGGALRLRTLKFPFPDDSGAPGIAAIAFEVPGAAPGAQREQMLVERLSARERQVLQLTVDGLTSAEIAHRLLLSPKSVETYRSRLMAKLRLADLPSLVKFALRHGLTASR
jgi:PAS domain S-box-containing protein